MCSAVSTDSDCKDDGHFFEQTKRWLGDGTADCSLYGYEAKMHCSGVSAQHSKLKTAMISRIDGVKNCSGVKLAWAGSCALNSNVSFRRACCRECVVCRADAEPSALESMAGFMTTFYANGGASTALAADDNVTEQLAFWSGLKHCHDSGRVNQGSCESVFGESCCKTCAYVKGSNAMCYDHKGDEGFAWAKDALQKQMVLILAEAADDVKKNASDGQSLATKQHRYDFHSKQQDSIRGMHSCGGVRDVWPMACTGLEEGRFFKARGSNNDGPMKKACCATCKQCKDHDSAYATYSALVFGQGRGPETCAALANSSVMGLAGAKLYCTQWAGDLCCPTCNAIMAMISDPAPQANVTNGTNPQRQCRGDEWLGAVCGPMAEKVKKADCNLTAAGMSSDFESKCCKTWMATCGNGTVVTGGNSSAGPAPSPASGNGTDKYAATTTTATWR